MQICTLETPQRNLRPVRVPEEAPQKIVDLLMSCRKLQASERISAADALEILNTSD